MMLYIVDHSYDVYDYWQQFSLGSCNDVIREFLLAMARIRAADLKQAHEAS